MLRMGTAGAETDVENDIHSKELVVVGCERGGGRGARRTSGTMRTTVEVVVGNIKKWEFGFVCSMARECGICLDPLKKPVSVPCGAWRRVCRRAGWLTTSVQAMFTAKDVSRSISAQGTTRTPRPVPPVARRSAQASLGRAFFSRRFAHRTRQCRPISRASRSGTTHSCLLLSARSSSTPSKLQSSSAN